MRRRVTPTNPTTTLRTSAKGAFGAAATAWSQTLTPTERAGWNLYASSVSVIDKLGATRYLTGMQWFIANNTPFMQLGFDALTTAPSEFSIGPSGVVTGAPEFNTVGTVFYQGAIQFEDLPIGSKVLFYSGKPLNPSINYFKGPYQFGTLFETTDADTIDLTDITGPWTYTYLAGQVMPVRAVVRLTDGRVSPEITFKAPVITMGP